MNTVEFTALLALSTVTTFSPGPNTMLSTALGANLGLRRSMRFVMAVPAGWGLLFSVCAAGMGALVMAIPLLRFGIQAMGVGYLLWLAIKLFRTSALTQMDASRLNITFLQGVMLQFLNIKAWMLALTVVGGWIAGRQDAVERFALILPLMLAFGLVSNLSYALVGSLLREWLSGPAESGARLRWFNRFMAVVLVATAGWIATLSGL